MMTHAPETPLQSAPSPPGPTAALRGSANGHTRQNPLKLLRELARDYGDLVQYQTPYGNAYLVNAPDLIGQVLRSENFPRGSLLPIVLGQGLLASDGPWWKKQRSLMLPAFHPHAMAKFENAINQITRARLRKWREYSARGEIINLNAELLHITLQVVIEALFSGDLHDEHDAFYKAIQTLLTDVGILVRSEFDASFTIDIVRNRRLTATLARTDQIVYDLIRARRAHDDKEDLLSLLITARDENGVGLSDTEIRDEVMTMVIAGNETTATALSWTCFILASQPEVEKTLREELNGVLGGRAAEINDLPSLPFLKMTFAEVLRAYPPVWSFYHKVQKEEMLGGYRLQAGAKIVISPYAMHYHPQYWPEADCFDPQRFTPAEEVARPRHSYIPFGAGRHVCIGQRLALMESYLVTAQIAQCFSVRVVEGAIIEPEPFVTMRLKNGLPVTLETREAATRVLGT